MKIHELTCMQLDTIVKIRPNWVAQVMPEWMKAHYPEKYEEYLRGISDDVPKYIINLIS